MPRKKAKRTTSRAAKVTPATPAKSSSGELVPLVPETMNLILSEPQKSQQMAHAATVVLARGEEQMTKAKAEALAKQKEALDEASAARTEATGIMSQAAQDYANEVAEVVKGSEVASMLQIPNALKINGEYEPPRRLDNGRWSKMDVILTFMAAGVTNGPKPHYDIVLFTRTVCITAPPEATKILAKIEKLEEKARELKDEAMKWQQKLSQMGQLERRVKANVAEYELRGTAEGTELLDRLLDHLEENIDALG